MSVKFKVFLGILVLSAPGWAQAEEEGDSSNAQVLDEIVVQTDREREKVINTPGGAKPVKEIAGSATVVTAEEVEAVDPISTIDVLQFVPGLNVNTEDGRGLRPNIGIRGIDPNRSNEGVLLTADGAPIQPALYGDRSAYYSLPVAEVERIEIIKGASSVLYGPGNIGGVVNFITKRPPEEPGRETTIRETVREGALVESNIAHGVTGENGVGARFSYQNLSGETVRDNTGTSVDNATVRVVAPTDNEGELSMRFNVYREDADTPGGLSVAEFDNDADSSSRSNDNFKGQRISFDSRYIQPMGDLTLDTLFYANAFERNWYLADGSDGVATTNTQFIRDFVVTGVEPRLIWNGWTLGARGHYERLDDLQRKGDSPSAREGVTVSDAELDTVALATYLQKELQLFDGFVLVPGVRYEHVEQRRETGLRTDPDLGPVIGPSGKAVTDEFVGGLHFNWKITEAGYLYGGAGRSFEPPTFSQAIDPTSGTDRDLDAETGMSYELGYRTPLSNYVDADIGVFLLDFDDKIISESGALRNAGETRHYGAELSLLARPIDELRADFTATLLETEFRGGAFDGNELPMAPNMRLGWGLSYFPIEPLTLRIDGFYVGEQFTDGANTAEESADGGTGELPSYHVWNLRGDYQWRDVIAGLDLGVFGGVANLFDNEYRERRQASQGGIFPGLTRTFYAGLEARF